MKIGDLFVRLALEMKEFSDGLDAAKKELEAQADKFKSVGESLTKAITLPLAGIATASLVAFGGFESAMNKVSALGDIFGKDLEKLRNQAMDLGAKTQYSAKQAADAMGNLAAAGFKTNEIYTAMPGVLALAATEQMQIADAAQITSDILKGYNLQVSDTQKIADILAKTSSSSSTSVKDLGYAFSYVGSVASALKIPMLDTAAALGVLADAGIRGERGGTALRNILNDLVSPSKAGAAAMKDLNIHVKDATGNLLPLAEIFKQLGPLMNNAQAATAIFGQRWSEVLPLIANGAAAFAKMRSEIESYQGAALKQAKIMIQGLMGTWEEFTSSLETVGIKIGAILAPFAQKLLKAANEILDYVGKLVDKFKLLPEELQTGILAFAALAAAIGPALLALGSFTAFLPTIVGGLGSLAAPMAGVLGGMSALTIGITAVAAAFSAWQIADMIESLGEMKYVLDNTKDAWENLALAGRSVVSFIEVINPGLGILIEQLKESITYLTGSKDAAEWMGKALAFLWDQMKTNFITAMTGGLNLLAKAFRDTAESMQLSLGKFKAMEDGAIANLKRAQAAQMEHARAMGEAAMKEVDAAKQRQLAARMAEEAAKSAAKSAAASSAALKKAAKEAKEHDDRMAQGWKEADKRYAAQMKTINDIIDLTAKIKDMDEKLAIAKLKTASVFQKAYNDMHEAALKQVPIQKSLYEQLNMATVSIMENGKQVLKTYQELGQNNPLIRILETNAKLEGAMRQLGLTSTKVLTELAAKAKESYQYIKALYEAGNQNVNYQQVLEAYQKMLEAERNLAVARGENVTVYNKQIADTSKYLDQMAGKLSKYGEMFNQFGKDIAGAFGNLSDGLVDSIIKGKGFSEAFKSFFDDIGKAATSFVKNILRGVLQDALQGNIKSMQDLGKSATKAFKDVESVFSGKPSSPGGLPSVGGADNAQKATQALQGGLTGWITAISSAVSAVTGVLQYLQGRRMEQDIGRIEVTTREIKAELMNFRADAHKRQEQLFAMKDQIVQEMQRYGDITGRFLSDILGTLEVANGYLERMATGGVNLLNGEGAGGQGLSDAIYTEYINALRANTSTVVGQTYANMINANATNYSSLAFDNNTAAVSGSTGAVQHFEQAVAQTVAAVADANEEYKDRVGKTLEELRKLGYAIAEQSVALADGTKVFADWSNQLAYVVDEEGKVIQVQKRTKDEMAELSKALNAAGKSTQNFGTNMQGVVRPFTDTVIGSTNSVASSMERFATGVSDAVTSTAQALASVPAQLLKEASGTFTAATLSSVEAMQAEINRLRTSIGLGSEINNAIKFLQNRIADLTPNPSPSRGPTDAPSSYWGAPYSGISSTPIIMNVNVNNAEAGKVANEMISTFRNRGVAI
jgi:TP901 family phage tail tape measure protein